MISIRRISFTPFTYDPGSSPQHFSEYERVVPDIVLADWIAGTPGRIDGIVF